MLLPQRAADFARNLLHVVSRPRSSYRAAVYYHSGQRRFGELVAQGTREVSSREATREVRRRLAYELLDGEAESLTFERQGVRWSAHVSDWLSSQLFVSGGYQADEVAAILRWVDAHRGQPVVVDVGANIGTTTVPLARSGRRVIAIEPVPANVALLQLNVTGLDVSVIPAAVSGREGEASMVLEAGNSGGGELVGSAGHTLKDWEVGGEVRVKAAPLDHLLSDVDPHEVALIWCDAQGGETDVISTGTKFWRAGVPLFAELWPVGLESHGTLAAFGDAVRMSFSRFIRRDRLMVDDWREEPIDAIWPWIQELRARSYANGSAVDVFSDALLIP